MIFRRNKRTNTNAFCYDWFVDYDADYGTDYLSRTGTESTIPDDEGGTYDVITDAAYGPHTRSVMDLYFPKDRTVAAPVVLYVHGGGFSGGDKEKILEEQKWGVADAYLQAGFVVASISYRLKADSAADAMAVERPDGDCDRGDGGGCRLDYIFRDGARAVQYLRYRSAELNLDPNRIAVWGGSAGGQIVTWVGTAPDLAVAEHEDPVLRESTRVQAVGHVTSQLSANTPGVWQAHLPFSQTFWDFLEENSPSHDINDALQMTSTELQETELGRDLTRVVNFLEAMSPDDPPFITTNGGRDHSESELMDPANAADARGWFVHHPRHSAPLYERCIANGLRCEIGVVYDWQGGSVPSAHPDENVQDFIFRVFGL